MEPNRMYTHANPRPRLDYHNPRSAAGNAWVKTVRKIYNPLGFKKGYNFPLFIIGAGGLLGFCLSRLMFLDYNGRFKHDVAPGEWYWYRGGHYRVGMYMHLVGVLIGGILATLQFVPIIRHKAILFHRINGYFAATLLIIGIVGAFMIARHTMGGEVSLQLWTGAIGSLLIIGILLAYINIKRLQIDQHRAWMLRVWTVAASIASLRLILLAAVHVCRVYGYTWHSAISCAEIHFMYAFYGIPDDSNPTSQLYPTCGLTTDISGIPTGEPADPATNTGTFVSVSSVGQGPENAAANIRALFPMAAWLALIIHVLVIEIYLWLTPAESYRLRTVSYERQVEKGLRPRGGFKDAGLSVTKFGNAPEWWSVPMNDYTEERTLMQMPAAVTDKQERSGSDTDAEDTRYHGTQH